MAPNDYQNAQENSEELERLFAYTPDLLAIHDTEGHLNKLNIAWTRILGYTMDYLVGRSLFELLHPDDRQPTGVWLSEVKEQGQISSFSNRFRCADGTYRNLEWRAFIYNNLVYASGRDVTEKRLQEDQWKQMAISDKLTGLNNRYYLETIINNEIERSERYQECLSLMIIDLDHFKIINDTWGHPVGDEVLKELAQLMKQVMRSSDILIRFGGEEFFVLMPNTGLKGALTAAEKLRESVNNWIFSGAGHVTASFGVAERVKSESFRNWYKRADEALYQAKVEGRNRVVSAVDPENVPIATVQLKWKNKWNSGHPEIDRQHQELLEVANRLINLSLSEGDFRTTKEQLEHLLDHIVAHFDSEEQILQKIDFPNRTEHAALHSKLVAKALDLKASFLKGDIKASTFFSFMVDDVIVGHMLRDDTRYFPYTRQKEIQHKDFD